MKTENKLIAEYGFRVFKNGNVRRFKKPYKTHINKSGYHQINISVNGKTRSFAVHRLVAELCLPNPLRKPEVNHKDGNKLNNRKNNLEWATRSENMLHGIKTGLIRKSMWGRSGAKHHRSKAVKRYDIFGGSAGTFESTYEAARLCGYNAKSIQDACKGRLKTYKGYTWSYK